LPEERGKMNESGRPTASPPDLPSSMDTPDDSNRDLRTGGAWTPAQRAKNDAIWLLARATLAACRRLPLLVLRGLGRGLGRAAHAVAAEARRTALTNVARVFPDLGEKERRDFVRRSFVTMGELLADTVALMRPSGGPLLDLTPEARAVLDEARREGRGVIFASAHLGPWERVAASLVAAGVPFAALARESYDPRFARVYEALREARGVRVVWRATRGATAGIVRTLREGGVLGIPMDLRARVASCEAPFLGHAAQTPVGPARIALKTGAAVVVGTVAPRPAPSGGSSEGAPSGPPSSLVITATRIPIDGLDGDDDANARELTARINQELSRRILDLPHAWVWMHERWTGEEKSMLVALAKAW
jgi:KDO2-lipid IV(A) lauroyltransferase